MNPELSRRVAKLMHTKTILALTMDQRMAFVRSVDQADDFKVLPKRYQKLILDAEAETVTNRP